MTDLERKKVSQLSNIGTLQAGDVIVGERTSGTTGLLTVGSLGGVSDGDKGDITVSASGATWTIDNDAVTYAKIQNISATDKLLGRSSALAGDIEEIACTAAGRALIDDADASAQRTTLGLVIGTDVQAYDAELAALAGLTSAADKLPYFTGSGTAALADLSSAMRTFLTTSSSTNLATVLTDETGTGALVFANTPTLTTPILGTPTSGTLTNCTGLPVAGGGTGIATATAYSVICAGTTATGAFQSLAALGSSGAKLTSNGAGALPSFKGGLTAFNASRNTNQTIAASTITKVQLSTENFDTGAYFDPATNYRYTPLIAGKYFFSMQATFNNVFTAGTLCTGSIYKNGTAVANVLSYSSLANQYVSLPVAVMLDMNGSTDYVEMYVAQYDTVSRDLLGGSFYNFFSGILMEAT